MGEENCLLISSVEVNLLKNNIFLWKIWSTEFLQTEHISVPNNQIKAYLPEMCCDRVQSADAGQWSGWKWWDGAPQLKASALHWLQLLHPLLAYRTLPSSLILSSSHFLKVSCVLFHKYSQVMPGIKSNKIQIEIKSNKIIYSFDNVSSHILSSKLFKILGYSPIISSFNSVFKLLYVLKLWTFLVIPNYWKLQTLMECTPISFLKR